MAVTIEDIRRAAEVIGDHIIRTPLVYSPLFSRRFGGEIYLKLENLQKTGSFKIRGAAHRLLKRSAEIESRGVVAASAGNHAQGVALAAREAGVPATIVMPEWASISKQEATAAYGGEVILHGQSVEESLHKAMALAEEGRTFIHPFDDPDIIAGQGTIALEILDELPETDAIIVPVGGGGLISGIAVAASAIRPRASVIGVEPAVCPSAHDARRKGERTEVPSASSIADGISVKQVGGANFDILQQHVDDIVLVDEEAIASAILTLLESKKILAEGAGAVPLAALMSGAVSLRPGSRTVLVISGGNVDSPLLGRILTKGLVKNGRIMRVQVRISDTPGSLARVLSLIAGAKANVLHIDHHRHARTLPLYTTAVDLELETRGEPHIREIEALLSDAGYETTREPV
jgi:threonine dehydratase